MTPSLPCLADVGGVSLQDFFPTHMLDPEYLIIVGCLLAVSLLVFIWAAFVRKPGSHPWLRRRHHHSHSHRPAPAPVAEAPEERRKGWFSLGKHHHRRHHRRRERPRNPTLAEAGGLPPIRATDQPHSPV